MPAIRFNSPEQFIEALEARRPVLQALDDARLKAHRDAEKEYLKEWRAACREAAKWDYDTLKENDSRLPRRRPDSSSYRNGWSTPGCPTSEVRRLDGLLATLRTTRQKTFTIEPGGTWRAAYDLLTLSDADEPKDMCA